VAAEVRRHVAIVQLSAVDGDPSVANQDDVAFRGDDALDEEAGRGDRHMEHDDVARCRFSDAVGQTVDHQPVVIGEGRRHAVALDAGQLHRESHRQRDPGGGDKCIARHGLRQHRERCWAGQGGERGGDAHGAREQESDRAEQTSDRWRDDSAR
jgi:hypothetical protein